jgi:hypothetical protein
MKCFLHRWSLRRHLDGGGSLSSATRAHVEKCAACAELLESHHRVIAALERPTEVEAPFLHGRIMASIRAAESAPARHGFSWVFAGGSLALAALFVVLTQPEKEKPVVSLNVPSFKFPQAKLLAIETELENLKADTRNAARALAASFLPDKD